MMKLDLQLFASGSFELAKATGDASWKSLQGKIEWSSVASGSEENQSVVTTKLYARTWTGGTSGRSWSGSVKVGSNTAHTFNDMGSSWANKDVASTYVLFQTYTDTIKHNDDGTCKINISASIAGPSGTSIAGVTSSGSKEIALDTIPRATTLDSFSGGKRIGVTNDVIINFTKKKSTFTTTLAYATQEDLSDLTEIVTKTTNASTYSWTIPINLLNKIPNSKTLDIYILLATFDGDTQIGTSQISKFTAIVYEENCKPTWNTHTIEETDTTAKTLVTTANKFVANISKPKFTFSATGQYGATISYYQINNVTRSSGFTDSSFNINGYTLKVVDSRGVTNTYTFNLTYVPYFTPVFEEVKLFRDVPTSNKVFSYFKIKFFNNTSSVKFDNPQALSYKFNYQESGGTSQEVSITPTTSDDGTSRYAENETELGTTFNYKKSVGWTFSFVDLSGKTFATSNTLPMGIPLMNGKMNSEGEQELFVNGKATFNENVSVSGNITNTGNINVGGDINSNNNIIAGENIKGFINTTIKTLPSGTDGRDYWNYLPNGTYWYANSGSPANMPSSYGWVIKTGFEVSGDFNVMYYTQSSGNIYRKSGNVNGVTGWVKIPLMNDLFYSSGNTYSIDSMLMPGHITGGTAKLQVIVNVPKRLDNITSISCTSLSVESRGISGYLNSATGFIEYVGKSGYTITCTKLSENTVGITITKSSAFTNCTNNTPIALWGKVSLTFS